MIRKLSLWLVLSISASLLLLSSSWWRVEADQFPSLASHPLPPFLVEWETKTEVGDYFSQVKNTPLGYLVWSQFPIKVYLDLGDTDFSPSDWVKAVTSAIAQWSIYLPLVQVEESEVADIIIKRSPPPIQTQRNRKTRQLEITRARSGVTEYEFYLQKTDPQILYHRMVIQINPGQSYQAILGTSLHELGHALGIWGHSQIKTDALYFSQVGQSSSISDRDINTLKKIYQQPTRLGWEIQ